MAYDVQPIGLDGWGDMAYDIQPIGLDGWGDMAYDIVPAADPFGLEGYGDMAYDIQPIGLDGWGDMAYDIVPAADPFGLEGYGDLGDWLTWAKPDTWAYASTVADLRGKRKKIKQKLKYARGDDRRDLEEDLRENKNDLNILYGRIRKKREEGKLSKKEVREFKRIAPKAVRTKRERAALQRKHKRAKEKKYEALQVKKTKYERIKPRVEEYEQPDYPDEEYAQLRSKVRRYRRYKPPVRRYTPVGADTDPPLASEEGAEEYGVVRLRRTVPLRRPPAMFGNIEIEEGFIEDLEGFGTTEEDISRLEATRTRLLRQRRRTPRRQRALRARLTRELQKVRAKITSLKGGDTTLHSELQVERVPYDPSSLAARTRAAISTSPYRTKFGTSTYGIRRARRPLKRRRRWRNPPSGFMRGYSHSRRRRVWNTSARARRGYYARRPRRLDSRPPMSWTPIPRPPNPYQPIIPQAQAYAPVPLPGPTYAPLPPVVQAYAPAPLPPIPTYAPAIPLPSKRKAQPDQAAQAGKVSKKARRKARRAKKAAAAEQAGASGTMKIALGLAVVGGAVWFLNKRKKGKKKSPTSAAFA
jgi:hypothetical protein